MTTAREYLRVSQDRSGRTRSLDEQHADNARAAEQHGWTLGPEYREKVVSASKYSRKQRDTFAALRADIRSGKFGADVLIMWESSRGSRKVSEWAGLIEECEEAGVRIHVTKDHHTYDLSRGRDRKSLHEDATDSEYESSKTSDRLTRAFAQNAEQGRPHGRVIWGYRTEYDPATGAPLGRVPDPDKAEVIRDMAKRVLAGESLTSVAARHREHDRRWTIQQVRRTLLTATYAGIRARVDGSNNSEITVIARGQWEEIISEADYWALRAKLTDPERLTYHDGAVKHLLTGIVACGKCGEKCRQTQNGNSPSYGCPRGHVSRRREDVDNLVTEAVVRRLGRRDALHVFEPQHEREEIEQATQDVREARRHLAEYVAEVKNIPPAIFARGATALQAVVDEAEGRARPRRLPKAIGDIAGNQARKRFDALDIAQKREVIRFLFSVTVLQVGKGQRVFDPLSVKIEDKHAVPAETI